MSESQNDAERFVIALIAMANDFLTSPELNPIDRLDIIEKMTDGICLHCGCLDPNNRCQCWNDE